MKLFYVEVFDCVWVVKFLGEFDSVLLLNPIELNGVIEFDS